MNWNAVGKESVDRKKPGSHSPVCAVQTRERLRLRLIAYFGLCRNGTLSGCINLFKEAKGMGTLIDDSMSHIFLRIEKG